MKKKYFLPAVLIAVAIIISLYFVFFRENEIEDRLHKSRYIINERIRNIELDRFPARLQINFEQLLRDMKAIELNKQWSAELEFDLTHPPFFDLRNLYLVSVDKIAVYDKASLERIWLNQLDFPISHFSLIDGNNLLVIDSEGHFYALNRNTGEKNWDYVHKPHFYEFIYAPLKPLQITNNDDRRLITSVVILPLYDQIQILDSSSGEVLFTLDFDAEIYHISDYDPIDNAIYVSYGSSIGKITLEKK